MSVNAETSAMYKASSVPGCCACLPPLQLTLHCGHGQVLAGGVPSWELLKAARLATAGSERKEAYRAVNGEAISAAADIRAVHVLQKLCRESLAALPSSLQRDIDLLRTSACSENSRLRLAVQWRTCYKGILQQCIAISKRTEAFWHESLRIS